MLVVQKGVDVEVKDFKGLIVLYWVVSRGQKDMVLVLIQEVKVNFLVVNVYCLFFYVVVGNVMIVYFIFFFIFSYVER